MPSLGNREGGQEEFFFLAKSLLHTNCLVCGCVVMVEKPWLVAPQFQPADSVFRLSSSDIICAVNLRSLCTIWFTLVMFSSVFVVKGRPVLRSSSTSSRPFTKCLCHPKICVLDVTSLPQTSLRSLKHSVGVYFSFTQKLQVDQLFHSSATNSFLTIISIECKQTRQKVTKLWQRLLILCYIKTCNTKME